MLEKYFSEVHQTSDVSELHRIHPSLLWLINGQRVCEECTKEDESNQIKKKTLTTKLSAHSYMTEMIRNYFQAHSMISFCKKKLEIVQI